MMRIKPLVAGTVFVSLLIFAGFTNEIIKPVMNPLHRGVFIVLFILASGTLAKEFGQIIENLGNKKSR